MRKFEVAKGFEDKGVILPTRATEGSAGYDIRVYIPNNGEVVIYPKKSVVLNTGIKVAMEQDEVFKVYIRSSVGIKNHLMLSNNVGIIDSDFYNNPENDGEIKIALYNYGTELQIIRDGDRIAQGIFVKYLTVADDITHEQRVGGIGSTDVVA